MTTRRFVMFAMVVAVSATPVVLASMRWSEATGRRDHAAVALAAAVRDAGEIIELAARQQHIESRQRPDEHVLALVNATLAHAGVPSQRLAGLQPEADVALPAPSRLRRQSVVVSFQQMSLVHVGEFLTAWRQLHGMWTPTRIELTKSRGRASDDQYDVRIVLSAVYLADGGAPAGP